MDVATRRVSAGAAHMNLVVELRQERLRVDGRAACAHEARATRGHGGNLQGFGGSARIVALGLRRVHLHEVGAEAKRHTGSARDEVGVLLGGDGLAARVDPQHNEQAVRVRLRDELASLGHHGGLVLAAQVDGVAQADDVHARFAHGEDGVQIVELGRVGIVLRSLHQVGLGVHLHEVVDLGVISGILRDETALTSKDAAHALTADLKEMLGLGVGQVDALAVEVLV